MTKEEKGAGRNKLPPKQIKRKLWIHIEQFKIDFFGGRFKANDILKDLIEEEYQKRTKQQ
jgi:hypothetical protein